MHTPVHSPVHFPLRYVLRPSRRLLQTLWGAHAAAALPWLFLWRQPWWMLAALFVVAVSLRTSLRAERRRAGVEMLCHETGEWSAPALGIAHDVRTLPEHVADFGSVLWMRWRSDTGRTHAAVFCPDHFSDAEAWHRFRLWFLHKSAPRAIRERLEAEEAQRAEKTA